MTQPDMMMQLLDELTALAAEVENHISTHQFVLPQPALTINWSGNG